MANSLGGLAKKFLDKAGEGIRTLGDELAKGLTGPVLQPAPIRVRPARPTFRPR